MTKKTSVTREALILDEANAVPKPEDDSETQEWSGDPTAIQTIEVSTSKEIVASYRVLKKVLECGPRKVEYFKSQSHFSGSNISKLELHPLEAAVVPKLLDFTCKRTKVLEMDTQSATAIFYLADYLGAEYAQRIAEKFILLDICSKNISTYSEHAVLFPHETLHDILAGFMKQNLKTISPSHPMAINSAPCIWEKVATKANFCNNKALCRHFTQLFAGFATTWTGEMQPATFQKVLLESTMPFIHPDAALTLAELNARFPTEEGDNTGSSLLDRCVQALAQSSDFRRRVFVNDDRTLERLEKLPLPFVLELWKQSNEESSKESPRIARLRREEKERLQQCSYQTVLQEFQNVPNQRRKELDAVVTKLRAECPQKLDFKDIKATMQYQSIDELYTMYEEVYDEVLASKSAQASDSSQPMPKKRRKKKPTADRVVAGLKPKEDSYPVGSMWFVRDATDGFGGHEYPACIIEAKGKLQKYHRTITFKGYKDYDRVVHVSELKPFTKKRQDQFQKEAIPEMKRNEESVAELRLKQEGLEDQDDVDLYEVGEVYYRRGTDGIDYPVKITKLCPRATQKCHIHNIGYGPRSQTELLRNLLPATPQRQSKFLAHQNVAQQKALEQTLKLEKQKSSKRKRVNGRTLQDAASDIDPPMDNTALQLLAFQRRLRSQAKGV